MMGLLAAGILDIMTSRRSSQTGREKERGSKGDECCCTFYIMIVSHFCYR